MDSAPVASTQYAQYKQFPNTYREPTNDEWLTEVNALRQRVQELEKQLTEVRRAERERCAKVCEAFFEDDDAMDRQVKDQCAAAIRAME